MGARDVGRWVVFVVIAAFAVAPMRARASDGVTSPSELAGDETAQDESADEEDLLDEASRRDPFEGLNRDVFSLNRRMDHWVFDPITHGYQIVVPAPGRHAIYRAFQNLDSPVILANHMLQFRVVPAAATTTRFVINTTIGIGGLFDPAAGFFMVDRVEGDFGQTLARYGTPSGPFLMLPVFGPSTVRDVIGDVVDILADPVSYLLGPVRWWTLVLGGGEGLTTREAHIEELQQLEAGSVDFYSALRSAYLQSRDAMVREARGASAEASIATASFCRAD
jgi:phospholipid-binding lipoprotein MlaA